MEFCISPEVSCPEPCTLLTVFFGLMLIFILFSIFLTCYILDQLTDHLIWPNWRLSTYNWAVKLYADIPTVKVNPGNSIFILKILSCEQSILLTAICTSVLILFLHILACYILNLLTDHLLWSNCRLPSAKWPVKQQTFKSECQNSVFLKNIPILELCTVPTALKFVLSY